MPDVEGPAVMLDNQLDPPANIYARLRALAGYTWDESRLAYHSSYDNW